MTRATDVLLTIWLGLTLPHAERRRDERGDVPGWVLITVMTAIVVMAILGVAQQELPNIFRQAINSVK